MESSKDMKSSICSLIMAIAAIAPLPISTSTPAPAQAQSAPAAPKPVQAGPRFMPQLTPEQIAALPKWTEMTMATRDGTKLAANVFLPTGAGPFPVVLSRTPYLKDALGDLAGYSAKKYTDEGYAFVLQDVRGKGHSEGFYEAFVPDLEDGYDTVEWAAKQPWSNGRVGMVGASALGITTNLAAMANPIRTRYRHGRDPDDVALMTPDKPGELHIDLWNTAFTFEKGHKIQVTVTSSNATKFEINPNTGEPFGVATSTAPRVATNTLYLDKRHPSAMILPVLKPAP
jgi:predicted acyl esterase